MPTRQSRVEPCGAATGDVTSKRPIEPMDLLALVATIGVLVTTIGTIVDINDVFWHVLIGQQVLDGVPIAELGSDFSSSLERPEWRTGAWGSEVLLAALYELGQWPLLLNVIRMGSVLAVSAVLVWGVLWRYPSRASVLPYLLAMAALAASIQERPQSLSFIGIAVAGIWWFDSVVHAHVPRWWVAGFASVIWANFHGLWVILPTVLILALLGRLLDHGRRDPHLRALVVVVIASTLGGLITPIGLKALLLPFRIQASGGHIIEWQATQLLNGPGYILLVAWSLTLFLLGGSMRRSWLVYALAVGIFGLAAVRNITPAVLLLAPLLAGLIAPRLGSRAESVVPPIERRRLRVAALGISVVGLAAIVTTMTVRDQGPPDSLPIQALETLRQSPDSVRLLNEYNWSGVALFYGPDGLRVGIDGRADYYGREYIREYGDGLDGDDLDSLLADIQPTHALLQPDTAAVTILRLQGWRTLREADTYVLLEKP